MTFTATAILASLLVGSVSAHKGASGVVKERMDVMQDFADATKGIKAMLFEPKSPAYGDLAAVRAAAARIAAGADHTFAHMYPKGSNAAPSDARAEIWAMPDAFQERAAALKASAQSLANTETQEDGQAAFKRLVAACAECHKRFRAKK